MSELDIFDQRGTGPNGGRVRIWGPSDRRPDGVVVFHNRKKGYGIQVNGPALRDALLEAFPLPVPEDAPLPEWERELLSGVNAEPEPWRPKVGDRVRVKPGAEWITTSGQRLPVHRDYIGKEGTVGPRKWGNPANATVLFADSVGGYLVDPQYLEPVTPEPDDSEPFDLDALIEQAKRHAKDKADDEYGRAFRYFVTSVFPA